MVFMIDLPEMAIRYTKKYGTLVRTKVFGKKIVFINNPVHVQVTSLIFCFTTVFQAPLLLWYYIILIASNSTT